MIPCRVIIEELVESKEYSTKEERTVIEDIEEAVYEERRRWKRRGLLCLWITSAICAPY